MSNIILFSQTELKSLEVVALGVHLSVVLRAYRYNELPEYYIRVMKDNLKNVKDVLQEIRKKYVFNVLHSLDFESLKEISNTFFNEKVTLQMISKIEEAEEVSGNEEEILEKDKEYTDKVEEEQGNSFEFSDEDN